jgi:Putative auto-transporter adhesin, head GIN domain
MKMMLMPVLCFGLLNFGSCNTNAVHGSGTAKSETRAVAPFSKIDLNGSPDVDVTVGPANSVEVTADDNLLPMIETTVSGETLKIGSKGSYSTSLGVKIKITAPSLDALAISGSGDVHVKGLKAGEMEAKITGSGNVTLNGGVDRLRVRILGSGDVRAADLAAKDVQVSVTGSGNASVRASEQLDASVAGSGNVRFAGNPPRVQKHVTGSGDIDPL